MTAAPVTSPGERRLFRFTLFMALVTAVLTVGTPLLGLQALHSSDVLREFYPWRSDAPEARAQNTILTDVVDVVTPMHQEAKRRFADGDYPLNTNLPSGGMALGSVPDWSVAGPLDLPTEFLPSWYAPGIVKLIELLVALVFTALFLRLLGLGRMAATFGGMLFMNSGFMLISTNWPHDGVIALIAPMFWGVERALQRRTLRSAIPFALATAASLLQGFPAITGYTLFFAGIYALVRVLAQREPGERIPAWITRARVLTILGVAVVLGFALTAFQLIPFSHQLHDFYSEYRTQNPHRILPLRSLATLAVPDGLGSVRNGVFYGIRNYAELEVFIGASAVVVVVAGLARMRRSMQPPGVLTYLFAATAGSVFLIYVGKLPLEILQKSLPMLFGINFIGRMRSVLGFFLAWLAAVALQAVIDRRGSGRWWLDAGTYVLGGLALAVGYASLWRVATTAKQTSFLLHHSAIPALAAGITVLAIVGSSALRGRARNSALALIPLALAIESVTFANGYLPRIDKSQFYPVTSTHRYVLDHIGHERMATADAVMYPGTTTYYGIRSVSAHGFHYKTWHDMLLTAGSRPRNKAPTLPLLNADDTVGESPILDRLGARFWVQAPDATPPGAFRPFRPATGVTTLAPGRPVAFAATPGTRLRSVRIDLKQTHLTPDERAYVVVEALDNGGHVVARGKRRIFLPSLGGFGVTTSQPTGVPLTLRITLVGTKQPVTVAASADGKPAVGFVDGGDDGLKAVFSDGAVVYERLHALPRIRWAPKSTVETDPTKRLAMLKAGVAADTVVLSSPALAGSGAAGSVDVDRDGGDSMKMTVHAQGAGYLVVADAMQDGWYAKVDGKSAPIVDADHAGVAVYVTGGTHTVTFTYTPRGWHKGVALTVGALLFILVVAFRRPRTAVEDKP